MSTPSSCSPWRWSVWGTLALLVAACRPPVTCAEGGQACGGDPTGTWNVVGACRDPVFSPPFQVTYTQQPVAMARQPNPVMSSSDWCSSLILGASGITGFSFPHETLSVSPTSQIVYTSDGPGQGTYQANINTGGPGQIDLSPACLTRLGASLSCEALAAALTDFAAVRPGDPGVPCSDGLDEPPRCQFYFTYSSIACTGLDGGGCHCTYQVAFAGVQTGRWRSEGTTLVHTNAMKMLPSEADYCVDGGGALSLWGHARTSLLDQSGIRTLELHKTP